MNDIDYFQRIMADDGFNDIIANVTWLRDNGYISYLDSVIEPNSFETIHIYIIKKKFVWNGGSRTAKMWSRHRV